eukprot:360678-Karenia_brevis.AAC.1
MGGSSQSTLGRAPTAAADPSPALSTVAEEIEADLDRPNILPTRERTEAEMPRIVDSDAEDQEAAP